MPNLIVLSPNLYVIRFTLSRLSPTYPLPDPDTHSIGIGLSPLFFITYLAYGDTVSCCARNTESYPIVLE